jgi:hypothetical protein
MIVVEAERRLEIKGILDGRIVLFGPSYVRLDLPIRLF